jgi:trigger factor
MKSTVEVVDALHRSVKVELPWSTIQTELDREYDELARKVSLPGFRKGKVPRGVLRQRFGRQVGDDVLARLIQDAYEAALIQHRIQPVARPELLRGELQDGQPYAFEARVEVRPEIELKQLAGFELTERKVEVSAEAVDKELEALRDKHAVLVPVEGRDEARRGDTAILDYRATRDGQPLEGGERKDHALELGSDRAVPGFEANIEGLRVGQRKTFELSFPAEGVRPELAGQRVTFEVELKALKLRELPALDDDFVRDLGEPGVESAAALRAKVERGLRERAEDQARRERRDELVDKLLEANPFPVPPAMVERQQEAMVRDMQTFLAMQGMDPEELTRGHAWLKKDMAGRAEREVRSALMLAAVAEREKLAVGDEEVERAISARAEAAGPGAAKVRAYYEPAERRAELGLTLVREKVLEHLLKLSNMGPAAAPAAPSAEGGAE